MIHHLNCATMCPRGGALFGGSGGPWKEADLVAHCLVVECGDGLVLVDTGFGTADVASPKRLGQPFRALIRPRCFEHEPAIRQLPGLGLDPRDVRHIIPTHLDVDHAGGLGDFPEAQVHVFAVELAIARNPPLRQHGRYVQAHWAHGPKWVEHEPGGDDWFGFGSVRVLGDAGSEIAIIPLHGHSAGSAGIAVNTPDGWILHCGDAFMHHGDLTTPPSSPAGLRAFQSIMAADRKQRLQNLERLRELARDHGDAVRIICAHDPVYMP